MQPWKQQDVFQALGMRHWSRKESLLKAKTKSRRAVFMRTLIREDSQSTRAKPLIKIYTSHFIQKKVNGTESPRLSNGKATSILQSLFRNNQRAQMECKWKETWSWAGHLGESGCCRDIQSVPTRLQRNLTERKSTLKWDSAIDAGSDATVDVRGAAASDCVGRGNSTKVKPVLSINVQNPYREIIK